jgi:hypothetical protein
MRFHVCTIYINELVSRLLRLYIMARIVVVAIHGITRLKPQAAILRREPEQYLRGGRELQSIAPVFEGAGTSYPQEPGAIVVVDRIGRELVAGERVVIMNTTNLEVAGAQRHAVQGHVRIDIRVSGEAWNVFACKHSLRPDPGTSAQIQRRLYQEMNLHIGGEAHG